MALLALLALRTANSWRVTPRKWGLFWLQALQEAEISSIWTSLDAGLLGKKDKSDF